MMNKLANLLGTNKKIKSVEVVTKELDKTNNEVATLEGEQSNLTRRIEQVRQAFLVIEANLVIDSEDKNALASKEKGNKRLELLKAELEDINAKLTATREKALEKKKELFQSQGEQARKDNVLVSKKYGVVNGINNFFDIQDNYKLQANAGNSVDLAEAYGLGDFQRLNAQKQGFIVSANMEDNEVGKQEAEAIVKEALQAMVDVLEKNDVQLVGHSAERLKGLGVELKG